MIFLFLNADEYLTALRVAELKAALGDPELASLNIVELTGSQTDPAALLAEASLMPFLAPKRLVIVRGYLETLDKRLAASKLPDSAAHKETAQFLLRLPAAPETAYLLFVDNSVDKRRVLWKGLTFPAHDGKAEQKIPGLEALIKAGTVKLEELSAPEAKALPGWIQQAARQQSISINGDAAETLANFVGPNLRQLANELEKLSLYADKRTITAQDVRAMVADASEEMIWNLTNGLTQRNPGAAMRALRDLQRNDQNAIGLVSAIARQYRLLIQIKTLQTAGQNNEFDLAKTLGEKPYPVKKAMGLTGGYSFAELEQIMGRLLTADFAMKTGAEPETTIAVLVAELAQAKKR